MNTVRLLPLLAIAAICLFALKSAGLIFSGGYMLTGSAPASAQDAKPDDTGKDAAAETPVAEENETPAQEAMAKDQPKQQPDAPDAEKKKKMAAADDVKEAMPEKAPGAKSAVLESLGQRRKDLDKRARELELRENLLKAAEQRVEARINELKAIEKRIERELTQRDEQRDAEYAKLVTLYSKMKPKRAARIFNRLEIGVLTDLVRRMSPRTISPIFAAMEPAVAERVTMEIANQTQQPSTTPDSLPKIPSENPG